VIRLPAVIFAALIAISAAAASVIETRVVTFRGNRVQAKVSLRSDPLAHGRHGLRVSLSTRRPGASAFRLVAVAQLDVWRGGFEPRSFVVEPRRNSALVRVAWRRRGTLKTHRQYLLARAGSLRFTRG
jgi:hypothetical protein